MVVESKRSTGSRPEGGGGKSSCSMESVDGRLRGASVAFLLSQLGAYGAARFAERLGPLDLTPAQAGILRLLTREPDLNQRRLASRLQAMPSRVVALVDEMEDRGLLVRHRRPDDRRSHALRLTDAGRDMLASLRKVATAHDADMTQPLTAEERRVLGELLLRLAESHNLAEGIHPGYRPVGPPSGP